MNDEFYVGYVPRAPASLGRRMARLTVGLILVGLGVGSVLLVDQPPFADSKFEYGTTGEYYGIFEQHPYPTLHSGDRTYLLVAPGKHGLTVATDLQSKSVQLRGTLIQRGADRMLEVLPASVRPNESSSPAPSEQPVSLGTITLRGEIVDSKCYLGVMNPGNRKVHRDCAVRCISGGSPPAFTAADGAGNTRVLLLVGSDGRALNRELLALVGEPVEISGELVRSDSLLLLKTEPAKFRRLAE